MVRCALKSYAAISQERPFCVNDPYLACCAYGGRKHFGPAFLAFAYSKDGVLTPCRRRDHTANRGDRNRAHLTMGNNRLKPP